MQEVSVPSYPGVTANGRRNVRGRNGSIPTTIRYRVHTAEKKYPYVPLRKEYISFLEANVSRNMNGVLKNIGASVHLRTIFHFLRKRDVRFSVPNQYETIFRHRFLSGWKHRSCLRRNLYRFCTGAVKRTVCRS